MRTVFLALAVLSALAAIFFGIAPLVGYQIFHVGSLLLLLYGVGTILLLVSWEAFPDPLYPGYPKESFLWWRITRRVLAAVLALILAGGMVLSVPMIRAGWFTAPPKGARPTVVVLGCYVKNGSPSRMLQNRLDAALRYLEANPDCPVVLSGGQGPDEAVSEAQAMEDYLLTKGIQKERIYKEDSSTNTRENLAFSAEVIREKGLPETVVLVTDRFHQLRGAIYARAAGLGEVYAVPSKTPWGLAPGYWVREVPAVAKAVLLDGGSL